jgi:UDP-N-acetylmuramoyl-tripeptide--D-alanyl-D-alanine ligase
MKIDNFYSEFFKPGNVSTDSRKVRPGDVFIALKGENFDGELFAESALERGAAVVVVTKDCSIEGEKIIHVEDTLSFLQQLARYHREFRDLQIIALTGTNGKTTTKELIRSVLSQKFIVQCTQGNLNNHIGVPLTLLSTVPETQVTIVEMGANHPGEIKALCEMAQPQSGLITNIGKAHLEGFGGYDGVKKAKAELFDFLKTRKGKIYYNEADEVINTLTGNYSTKIAYNSPSGICTGKILATLPSLKIEITDSVQKTITISSSLFGNYNLENVIAAAAIGLDLGLTLSEIKSGVENYSPDSYRSQIITLGTNTLILDCYNANPTSMRHALISFNEYDKSKKVVILGGMRELGIYEKEEHQQLAGLVQQLDFDLVILVGKEFEGIKLNNSLHFESIPELKEYIQKANYKHTAILIKGSRANKLEEVADVIRHSHLE